MNGFNKEKYGDVDFGSLFEQAKARHKLMADKVKECEGLCSRLTEMHDAQNDWYDWCRENLTDRGIHMTVDAGTGAPRGLFVMVAGKEW